MSAQLDLLGAEAPATAPEPAQAVSCALPGCSATPAVWCFGTAPLPPGPVRLCSAHADLPWPAKAAAWVAGERSRDQPLAAGYAVV